MNDSILLRLHQHLLLSIFFIIVIQVVMKWYLIVILSANPSWLKVEVAVPCSTTWVNLCPTHPTWNITSSDTWATDYSNFSNNSSSFRFCYLSSLPSNSVSVNLYIPWLSSEPVASPLGFRMQLKFLVWHTRSSTFWPPVIIPNFLLFQPGWTKQVSNVTCES